MGGAFSPFLVKFFVTWSKSPLYILFSGTSIYPFNFHRFACIGWRIVINKVAVVRSWRQGQGKSNVMLMMIENHRSLSGCLSVLCPHLADWHDQSHLYPGNSSIHELWKQHFSQCPATGTVP